MPRKRDKGKARKARRAAEEAAAIATSNDIDGINNHVNMPNSFLDSLPDEIARSLADLDKSSQLFSEARAGSVESGKELYKHSNRTNKKNGKTEEEKVLCRAFEVH